MADIKNPGWYEITEVFGQGAMAILYKGVDPKIGRTVALKTLKTTGEIPENQLAEFKRRFSQEAQSAGRLNHPNKTDKTFSVDKAKYVNPAWTPLFDDVKKEFK